MTLKRRDSLPIECDTSPRIDSQSPSEDMVPSELLTIRQKKRTRNRSSSMSTAANALGYRRDDDDMKVRHHLQLRHQVTHSNNMMQNLQKYNKKEQEDLISIQTNLRKWIGQHQNPILSQFLDLMKKIAPHISTQQATNMFNQMDPSNNGQIPTALLLHDEFLPRMILDLFETEDTQSQAGSIVDDFAGDSDSNNSEKYSSMQHSDLISSIKRMKRETKHLRSWIVEHGQPAVEKVDEMQRMLDVYEAERTDKQSELQSFKKRLSTLDVIQSQLQQSERHSRVLLKEHDSLLLSVEQSAQKTEIERKKYNAALREAMEYKRLNKELHQINEQYNQKNALLYEKLIGLEEENQSLRQRTLQFETEQIEKMDEIDDYKHKIDEMQRQQNENVKQVRWGSPEETLEQQLQLDRSLSTKRRRRMTLKGHMGPEGSGDEGTLDSDIEAHQSARRRRNTISRWYEAHAQRRTSYVSLPPNETNSLRGMPSLENNTEDVAVFVATDDLYDGNSLDRQSSLQSFVSTMSVAPTPVGIQALTQGHSMHAAAQLFEDAYAQEIKTEVRKQIEKELSEDYELKLKQRDIQYQMELHKQKNIMEEEQRQFREKYEKRIDELNAKVNLNIQVEMQRPDSVHLDAEITDISSDDEKQVFDQNMMMNPHMDDDDDEHQPLIKQDAMNEERERIEKENARIERAVHNERCLSCFGLFTGRPY
eukprot:615553_1